MDHQSIAKQWRSRGFSCHLWVDPPGQRWEDFRHPTDELMVVLEGRMEFEIEGRRRIASIGEEVFIPAGAVHSVRNIGADTARWLYGYRHG